MWESVSRVLLFLAGDRNLTSPVLPPVIMKMADGGWEGLGRRARRRRISLGSDRLIFRFKSSKSNENPPCLYEITIFIRFVEKEFEIYADSVGWRLPASVSAN